MEIKKIDKVHTFAICAYKESLYLEACIKSLLHQTVKSEILMVTSTPSLYLENIASKYNIPLYVNNGENGIVQDWNFAYSKVSTPYLTIAHQDDIYFETYCEEVLKQMLKSKMPLIGFCDYVEIRDEEKVYQNKLLKVKRLLICPLKLKKLQSSKFIRRRILSFGSPICCPSVMFARENLPFPVFSVGFRSDEDWEAWEKISKRKGQFIYVSMPLMGHRIHEDSETSAIIGDNQRTTEDYEMFCKFWPKWIAKLINKVYTTSQQSNNL